MDKKPPFDGPYKKVATPVKDKSGAVHSPMSRAKHLARMFLQKKAKKEQVEERALTPAEKKKREEIARAIERDNPGMDMSKKMAIATAQAKKVAEAKAGWSDNNGTVKKYEPQKKAPTPHWRFNKDGSHTDMNTGKTHHRDGSVTEEAEQVDEVVKARPTDAALYKTLGPTKNHQQGVEALKKAHGFTSAQAKGHINRLMTQIAKSDKTQKEEVEVEEGLQQKLRKYVPGYAKKQIDKKMDAEKFGKRDVDRDANYWRYKKVQDKLKKEEVEESVNVAATLKKAANASKGVSVKFDDGTTELVDQDTAKSLLSVHQKLNTTNQQKMEDNLFKSSEDFMKMVDFAMSRAQK